MGQYVWALRNLGFFGFAQKTNIRNFAVANFSVANVVPQFEEFFRMIEDTRTAAGWYTAHQSDDIRIGRINFAPLYEA